MTETELQKAAKYHLEGRVAFIEGKSPVANPYHGEQDAWILAYYFWFDGYRAAKREYELQQKLNEENKYRKHPHEEAKEREITNAHKWFEMK